MKRRSFLQATVAALGATAATEPSTMGAESGPGELYELRVYTLKAGKQPMLDDYLGKALFPALKRYGIGPVGAFVEKGSEGPVRFYVLIVHSSADQFATLGNRLAMDDQYQKAAAEYLAVPPKDPVYTRIESSFLLPIEGMPRLTKPDSTRPRLLNLRIYESHNERAAKKKIEMFNKSELAIFRRVGLAPVFFGETIAGAAMPNLTYMLVFPDEAGREAAWSRFKDDAEWKKLRAIPEYADKEIVSGITNKLLTPASYSEI
jgi:NIPSNAP